MATQLKSKPMRTVWHSLLWKEWHEHKWKLLGLSLAVFILPFMFLQEQPYPIIASVAVSLMCYGILAGIFIGMGTAAGESQRGTMPFLQKLPISIAKPAAIKLLMSLLTVVVPVLVISATAYLYLKSQQLDQTTLAETFDWASRGVPVGGWKFSSLLGWFAAISLTGGMLVSSLLLWMATIGVNRSNEIRAGAIGFLAIAIFWAVAISISEKAEHANLYLLEGLPMAAAPGGVAYLNDIQRETNLPISLLVLTAVIVHSILLHQYLRRFGRKAVRPARTIGGLAAASTTHTWLAPPRSNQLSAIIWKQVNETGPLALMAVAGALVMTCLAYYVQDSSSPQSNEFGMLLTAVATWVGFLVTLVTGMGVFLEDLKPGMETFWRSRPIKLSQWFIVKYLTGLTVLILSFGSLISLGLFLQENPFGPNTTSTNISVGITFGAMIFVLIYTLSMASYGLSRQPIIAAVMTLGLFLVGSYAVQSLAETYFDRNPHWSYPFGIILLAQVAATVVAWLAIKRNFSWQK